MSYRVSAKELKSIRKIEGKISSFRSIHNRRVILEIDSASKVVDLTTEEPWVVRRGDQIVVAGLNDNYSGKFFAFGYINQTKKVKDFGESALPSSFGYVPAIIGVVFLLIAGLSIWLSLVFGFALICLGVGLTLIALGRGIVLKKKIRERIINVLTT
tara:strand:- start:50 stop:520 length:471 start_codon:yes stop_codon:yes gene_type:complete